MHYLKSLVVELILFPSIEAAEVYLRDGTAVVHEQSEANKLETINVGDIPGSRGWIGPNDRGGGSGLVLFTHEGLHVSVACHLTAGSRFEHRACVTDAARAQYQHVERIIAETGAG